VTSATGGTLTTTLPNEVALRRFLQGLIAGITGLPGTMVRPRWQRNPVRMPGFTENWCAFTIGTRTPDANAFHEQTDDLTAKVVRHEALTLPCSFYGPDGASYAELLRDGLELGQNREVLLIAAMGFVECGPLLHLPELHNEEWYDRYDMEVFINREIGKQYDILCFTGAIGAIITETLSLPFEVSQP